MTHDNTAARTVTLVLVNGEGRVLGSLAPLRVDMPWWNAAAPVVQAVHARDGLQVTLLRLLSSELAEPPGGAVSYLAQAESPLGSTPLEPWQGELPEHPLRNAYARVGGPQADLAWAQAVLDSQGLAPGGPAEQIRTWNLSSLWRLPLRSGGNAWLKAVPRFFAHEGALLALLAGAPVPSLLGRGDCRVLLAEAPGDDLHHADLTRSRAMIELLVKLQAEWQGRTDQLLSIGLPDWRAEAMTSALAALIERRAGDLAAGERSLLGQFIDQLAKRFAALEACGLPDTLVHGDFHRGNFRGGSHSLTLLDWGDSGYGHPLLDQPAFLTRLPPDWIEPLRQHWQEAWLRHCPQAEVARAAQLLAPLGSLRQALIYQRFLDRIEDAEQGYHRADVPDWLRKTAHQLAVEAAF